MVWEQNEGSKRDCMETCWRAEVAEVRNVGGWARRMREEMVAIPDTFCWWGSEIC